MRRLIAAVVIAVPCLLGSPTWAASQTVAPPPAPKADLLYPIALAAGALAGVAAVNVLTYGLGTLPLTVGIETTAPMVSPAAAAASRIFVITSGILGAWVVDALYPRSH